MTTAQRAKTCKVEGCDRTVLSKMMCRKHYERSRRAAKGARAYLTNEPGATCAVDGCDRPVKAKRLCNAHYMRTRRGEDTGAPVANVPISYCTFGGCDRPVHGRGLCGGHYWQKRHGISLKAIKDHVPSGGLCHLEDCGRANHGGGLCSTHYFRKINGAENWARPIREKAANGSGWVTKDGYRMMHVDGRRVFEHVYNFELVLGRRVRTDLGENVHHVNGNKLDNTTDGPPYLHSDGKLRSGNLELWSKKQPAGQEIGPKLAWAREILALYGKYETQDD